MIKYINGNILNVTKGLICQQVNCQGVMGAGLAKQIKDKYPQVYNEYKEYILSRKVHFIDGHSLLGLVNPVFIDKDLLVLNIFGQENFGTTKVYTDYNALEKAFRYIESTIAPIYNLPVYVPYGIGCGLAGGSWDIVESILNKLFKDSSADCIVVKYEEKYIDERINVGE